MNLALGLNEFQLGSVASHTKQSVISAAQNTASEPFLIKYFNGSYSPSWAQALWRQEYKTLLQIDSDYVLRPIDFIDNNQHPAILFNFAEVVSFEQFVENTKKQDNEVKLRYAIQLVELVNEIHKAGWRIGNLCSSSILFNSNTQSFLLCDMSMATQLDNDTFNEFGTHKLTDLAFLAPEQTTRIATKPDYRSDYYSLGILLYQLFVGRLPFEVNDSIALINAHIKQKPRPLTAWHFGVSQFVSEIVLKLLEKQAKHRYQSCFGLIKDLQLAANSKSSDNILGQHDVPEKLMISEKILGRKKDLDKLTTYYQNSLHQGSQICFIKGYSGIGKSSLAYLLRSEVISQDGLFIEGKAEQYNQSRPFSAILQSIEHAFAQLSLQNQKLLNKICVELSEVLGANLTIFVDLIPGAKPYFSFIPERSDALTDVESRIQRCFIHFMEVLTKHINVVLFLDDLQWLDQPSFNLMRLAFTEKKGDRKYRLFFLGAYRDNEVDASHPLLSVINAINAGHRQIHEILLDPLSIDDTNEFVASILRQNVDQTTELSKACYQRTQGNPFYLVHFLQELAAAHTFTYCRTLGHWQWDLTDIERYPVTDNVVEFLTSTLNLFDDDTKTLLAVASHLGNNFSLATLCKILHLDQAVCSKRLFTLITAGYIVPLNEHYRFSDSPDIQRDAVYKFSHDRVLQASHNLLDKNQSDLLKLSIATHLLELYDNKQDTELLFIILTCLNDVQELITDKQLEYRLMMLNLEAGHYTKETAAYIMAEQFLTIAKHVLLRNLPHQGSDYQNQILPVFLELSETFYLSGQFEAAQSHIEQGIELLDSYQRPQLERVGLEFVQIDMRFIEGRFPEIKTLLVSLLNELSFEFNTDTTQQQSAFMQFMQDEDLYHQIENIDVIKLPEMTSDVYLSQMRAFNAMLFCAYQLGDFSSYVLSACYMVNTTIKHGQCDYSGNGLTAFSTALSVAQKGYDACYKSSLIAMELVDHRKNDFFKIAVYDYFAGFYQHWGDALSAGFEVLRSGISMGSRGANPLSAGFCAMKLPLNRLINGDNLDSVLAEAEQCLRFVENSHQSNTALYILMSSVQPCKALMGLSKEPLSFDCDLYNVSEHFNGDFTSPSIHLALYGCATLRNAYLLQDLELQQQFRHTVDVMTAVLPDCPSYTEAKFYLALSYCYEAKQTSNADLINKAELILSEMLNWAEQNSHNFALKAYLVKAEVASFKQDIQSAMNCYRDAIDLAEKQSNHLVLALAHELYGNFYKDIEQPQTSMFYLKRAWHLYNQWGAKSKCIQLATQWPSLMLLNQVKGMDKRQTQNSIADLVDIETIARLSQKISEEIHLGPLLKNVLSVFSECTGSSVGAVALTENDDLSIKYVLEEDKANYRYNIQEVTSTQLLIRHFENFDICIDFMHRALASKHPVVENQIATSVSQENVHSHMSLPILSQEDKVIGILYLESHTVNGSFTEQHVALLKTLMGQVGVSLMNAQLYDNLEALVNKRTEQLERLTLNDELTKLANRRGFEQHIERQWRAHLRSREPIAVMMLDIDYFKQYNDHYGHPQGDVCLQQVAKILRDNIYRSEDIVARYGGEEFIIVIANSNVDVAKTLANRIIDSIAMAKIPHQHSQVSEFVSLSIGVSASIPSLASSPDRLIHEADDALYRAKKNGRNQLSI